MINYYLLTKPGIVLGNLVTVAAGFLLASKGSINLWLFFQTLLGLALVMASACVFNNYIDRNLDQQMERTKNRPLASGAISVASSLLFGSLLGIAGGLVLYAYTNALTVGVTALGFLVYVVLYSLWKRHTIYGTAIGSIAGAVPPVVGYCAVSDRFDTAAVILFAIMVLWQMPHFFAIAFYHIDDYTKADVPVLPVRKSAFRAKVHMTFYIAGFIGAAFLLTFYNYTGYLYLVAATSIGLAWLCLCLQGFSSHDDRKWGGQMFRLSLVVISAISLAIPFSVQP